MIAVWSRLVDSQKLSSTSQSKRHKRLKKSTHSAYRLELLEPRILLSAELAGAVQPIPVEIVDSAHEQAVVLTVPTTGSSQQVWSVSEMLAMPASSFVPTRESTYPAQTHTPS